MRRRRGRALRRRYGHGRRFLGPSEAWAGTDYIERRYANIQPSLATAAIGHGPLDDYDRRAIQRGSELLTWLLSQSAPNAKSQRFLARTIGDVRRMLGKAEAR